jgi:hypothetical protein
MARPEGVEYAALRGITEFVRSELRRIYGSQNVTKVRLTTPTRRIDAEVEMGLESLRFAVTLQDGKIHVCRSIWQVQRFELADPNSFDQLTNFLTIEEVPR